MRENGYRKQSFGSSCLLRGNTLTKIAVFCIFVSVSYGNDTLTVLEHIQDSFTYQKSLFDNLSFTSYYIQPYSEPVRNSGKKEYSINSTSEKRSVLRQEYQLNKNEKFLFRTKEYVADSTIVEMNEEAIRSLQEAGGSNAISFNGELYYYESRTPSEEAGLGSIFTPQQPYDYSKVMIKPTFFMDYIFNKDILKILKDPDNVQVIENSKDKIQLYYKDPDSNKYYDLTLDPKQDFVITRMSGNWNANQTFEKKMEYKKTSEGFYYPSKSTISIGGGDPMVMYIQECKLNCPEGDYVLDIPIGTRMTDHTKGFPIIYYQGQPGRTAEESGDPSIYAVADQLNSIAFHDPDKVKKIDAAQCQVKKPLQNLSEPELSPSEAKSPSATTNLNTNHTRKEKIPNELGYKITMVVAVLLIILGLCIVGKKILHNG